MANKKLYSMSWMDAEKRLDPKYKSNNKNLSYSNPDRYDGLTVKSQSEVLGTASAKSPTLASKVQANTQSGVHIITPGETTISKPTVKPPALSGALGIGGSKTMKVEPPKLNKPYVGTNNALTGAKLPSNFHTMSQEERAAALKGIKPVGTIQANDGQNYSKPYESKYKYGQDAVSGEQIKGINDVNGSGLKTAFGEGVKNQFAPVLDKIAKPTENDKWIEEQLKQDHAGQYTMGNLVGGFMKYAPTYRAISPAVEGMKVLQAINNPFVRTMVQEGIKDAIVNVGYNIPEGMLKGDSAKDIGETMLKQIPQDILFNSIMYGAGKALKGMAPAQQAEVEQEVRNVVRQINPNPPKVKTPELKPQPVEVKPPELQVKQAAATVAPESPISAVEPPKLQAVEAMPKATEGVKVAPPKAYTKQSIHEMTARKFKGADEIESVIKELEDNKKSLSIDLQLFAEKKIKELRQRLSKFHSNVQKNEFFHDETKKLATKGDYMYDQIVNKETYATAQTKVAKNTASASTDFMKIKPHEATADDVATGYALIAKYQNEGNYDAAANVAFKMRGMATKSGQTVQAFSISNKLTPEGRLLYSAKVIEGSRTPRQNVQIESTVKKAQAEFDEVEKKASEELTGEIGELVEKAKGAKAAEVEPVKPEAPETAKPKAEELNPPGTELKPKEPEVVETAKPKEKPEPKTPEPIKTGEAETQKSKSKKPEVEAPKPEQIKSAKPEPSEVKAPEAKELNPEAEAPKPEESKPKETKKKIEPKEAAVDEVAKTEEAKPKETEAKKSKAETEKVEKKTEPKPKEPKGPEEILAQKIVSRISDSKGRKSDPVNEMVSTLFKVAKSSPIEAGARPKAKTAIEFIGEAMRNRQQYKDVWNRAQAIIKTKYKDNPEALAMLKEYFENPAKPVFSADQFDSAVNKGMRELDVKIGQIVKQHYSTNSAARKNLVDKLVKEAGLDGEHAKELEKLIRNRMKELTKKAKEDTLERLFKARKAVNPKAYDESIRELSNVGAFKNENYKETLYGKISPLLDKAIRKNNVDFGELIKKSAQEQNLTERQLMNTILKQTGLSDLSEKDAEKLAGMLIKKFHEVAKGKRAAYYKKFMKASKEVERRTFNEKLIEMINVGGFEDPSIRNAFAQKMGIPSMNDELVHRLTEGAKVVQSIGNGKELVELIKKQADFMGIKPSKRALKIIEEYEANNVDKLKELAMTQMDAMVAEQIPASFAGKASTYQVLSHLLNDRTMNRNISSNTGFGPVEKAAQVFSIPFDKLAKLKTGERTVVLPKLKGDKTAQKQAAKDTYAAINLGVSRYGDKYNVTSSRTFKKGVLGWGEKILRYGLEIPDEFTKAGRKAEAIRQMTAATGLSKPTQRIIEQAEHEAKYTTFQDDSLPAGILKALHDLGNVTYKDWGFGTGRTVGKIGALDVKEFGAGDLIVRYTRVPGNIISRAVEYTPAGFAKALLLMKHADDSGVKQREIVLSCGRAMTGPLIISMGALMHRMGIMVGDDKFADKDKKALQNSEGKGAYRVNVSALGRLVAGGDVSPQDGDKMYSYNWFQPMSILISMGAAMDSGLQRRSEARARFESEGMSEAAIKESMKNVKGISIKEMADAGVEEFLDLPLIGTIRRMTYAEGASDVLTTPIVEGATGFIPSVIRQAANVIDPTARETYVGDSKPKTLMNKAKSSIPGLKNTLEPRIDPFGREIKYSKGIIPNMINPANKSVYAPHGDITPKLEALEKSTGEVKQYPSTSLSKSMEGMTEKEKTEFKKLAGQKIREEYDRILGGRSIENMSKTQQIKLVNALSKAQTDARKQAKEQIKPPELSEAAIKKAKAKTKSGWNTNSGWLK